MWIEIEFSSAQKQLFIKTAPTCMSKLKRKIVCCSLHHVSEVQGRGNFFLSFVTEFEKKTYEFTQIPIFHWLAYHFIS